jgi:hypothetical protein
MVVTLDDRARVRTVRDERISALLSHRGIPDAHWTADQFTQETIGTDLAEAGWEAISEVEAKQPDAPGPATVIYLVRRV